MSRRRRSLLLLGLALLLGGLAASDVASREAALEHRLGPLVPVVVARAPVAAGETIPASRLALRHVPARFAPEGAHEAVELVAGRRAAGDLAAGADVTAAALAVEGADGQTGAPVRRGERIADVVATGSPELIVPGTRVDVLVTREAGPGRPGGTALELQDVEVLTAAAAPAAEGGGALPQVAAGLRVTLRQAVLLTAAQGAAREIRLLPRAAGDTARAGPLRSLG